jgi:hypothetical protein
MQLGTETNGLGGPSIRASLGHSVAARSCTSSTSPPQFTNHHSRITPHKSAPASSNPHISPLLIASHKLLEIELTPSASAQNAFLIATICPTFTPAPLSTHHSSLIPRHCLPSFLFDTNKPNKTIIIVSLPLKTKEKQFSIRYKWSLRGTGLPAAAGHLACAPFCSPNRRQRDNATSKHATKPSVPRRADPSDRCCPSRITKDDPPITNHAVLVPPSRAALKWNAFQHAPLTERGATL